MKLKAITFFVAFFITGLAFGLLLYFFDNSQTIEQIVFQSVLFGFFWALFEVFILVKVRERFKKKK